MSVGLGVARWKPCEWDTCTTTVHESKRYCREHRRVQRGFVDFALGRRAGKTEAQHEIFEQIVAIDPVLQYAICTRARVLASPLTEAGDLVVAHDQGKFEPFVVAVKPDDTNSSVAARLADELNHRLGKGSK